MFLFIEYKLIGKELVIVLLFLDVCYLFYNVFGICYAVGEFGVLCLIYVYLVILGFSFGF